MLYFFKKKNNFYKGYLKIRVCKDLEGAHETEKSRANLIQRA